MRTFVSISNPLNGSSSSNNLLAITLANATLFRSEISDGSLFNNGTSDRKCLHNALGILLSIFEFSPISTF